VGRLRQRSDGTRHPVRWGLAVLACLGGVAAWVQLSRRSAARRVPTMTIGGVERDVPPPRAVGEVGEVAAAAPAATFDAPSAPAPSAPAPAPSAPAPSPTAPTAPTAPAGPFGPGSSVPNEDGSAPEGYTIKGNERSRLYHGPDSPHYGRLRAQVWFVDEDAAREAGFQHWDRRRR
jgi:hypothetical protein